MDRYFGIFGIIAILGIAFLLSNNKKAIDKKLVFTGLLIQALLAVFILKVPLGQIVFAKIGYFITMLLDFSNKGADFVFGPLVNSSLLAPVFGISNTFIFFFKIIPTIIFVSVLVSIAYHVGIMQRIVAVFAKAVHKLMGVSGSEALSNVGSAFVGQVEAQIMIKPYISGMTKSELLASMAGSMACIAGGVMAVYISMGVPAEYLIAASIMAAPGALVIAKIVYPETADLWKSAGARILEIDSRKHDTIVAHTSHVPHILATILTLTALGDGKTRLQRENGCAGGFRDTTRIASSAPQMWREIIENNRDAVLRTLVEFERNLKSFRDNIRKAEYSKLEEKLQSAKDLRDSWITRKK